MKQESTKFCYECAAQTKHVNDERGFCKELGRSKKKHVATCGLYDVTGNRIGTRYAYTARESVEIMNEKCFRWRNDFCRRLCLDIIEAKGLVKELVK